MTTIYKYRLLNHDEPGTFTIHMDMPSSDKIIHFGRDLAGDLCMWAVTDPTKLFITRTFHILMTGQHFDSNNITVLGTFVDHSTVLHLAEALQPEPKGE